MRKIFFKELANEEKRVIATDFNKNELNKETIAPDDLFIEYKNTEVVEGHIIKKEVWVEVLKIINENENITKEEVLHRFEGVAGVERAIGAFKDKNFILDEDGRYRMLSSGKIILNNTY